MGTSARQYLGGTFARYVQHDRLWWAFGFYADVGPGAERRLARNVWLGVEVGVGGFRGLRLSGSDVESPDLDVSTAAYVDVALKFRPSLSF